MAHRKISDEAKAAHVLLPKLLTVAGELHAEAKRSRLEAGQARQSDARADWAQIVARAEGRAEGAATLVAMVRELAKG